MVKRIRPTKATNLIELANNRGQGDQPTYVELSEYLTVGIRLMNMESMISLGILPEPLMEAAINMGKKASGDRGVVDFKESAALQDVVCAAIIVDPPWAMLDEVEANDKKPIPGKLWLGMLTDEEIGGCFQLVYKGLESWEKFRDEQQRRATLEASKRDGSEAVEPNKLRLVDPDERREDEPALTASEVDA